MAWVNVYAKPRLDGTAINPQAAVLGFYPGNAFFPTKEAAEEAARHPLSIAKQGEPMGCVEVRLPESAND